MAKEVSEERQPGKDYVDPPPAPLIDMAEIKLWSFYRALIAEFIATLLFLYITVATVIGYKKQADPCAGVGLLVLAPLPIGFAVFMVHLATIPITGTGINPARSFGAAVIYNNDKAWDDHYNKRLPTGDSYPMV
ncbi:hypothetical protein GH714_032446 [Hevea brasiliensis]|uniref:Uncharacterized protein n=1 Tax=Hevea brasiliensis TaxID=3981 RepID=A0A6A6LKX9_HEVBR|nr:hypothetical protein GH714_032446 [Hevea brasiliensis]